MTAIHSQFQFNGPMIMFPDGSIVLLRNKYSKCTEPKVVKEGIKKFLQWYGPF